MIFNLKHILILYTTDLKSISYTSHKSLCGQWRCGGIVRSAREKGKPGRKRSATKEDNEQLVKKGKDVERNE